MGQNCNLSGWVKIIQGKPLEENQAGTCRQGLVRGVQEQKPSAGSQALWQG